MNRFAAIGLAGVTAVLIATSDTSANPRSEELRAQAARELYNLDREQALETYRLAIAADPEDAATYRGLASALFMRIGFERGTMTVDSYLGRVTGDVRLPPPPKELAAAFGQAIDRATSLSRRRLSTNPKDADALYQLGAAVGLAASYTATVEGSVRAAFWSAREAYNAHERVLELDPRRQDAGLVVGTYRYLIATMSLPFRWAAYASGFGGGRERGLQLIEAAAGHPGENQIDARIALVLVYNRERRYREALRELAALRAQYPRNRLLWLESGSTALRGAQYVDAEQFLNDGIAKLAADRRSKMFGEEAMWYYKRGATRAALKRDAAAEEDLRQALTLEARPWIRGRVQFELGKLALKAGNRQAADSAFRQAISLAQSDDDAVTADAARRLMKMP